MSISVMKKLTVITPRDSAESVMHRLVKQRCIEVRIVDTEEYDGMLSAVNYGKQRSEISERIKNIDSVLPVLCKYSSRRSRLGDDRVKVNRGEFISDGSYANAQAAVQKAQELILELDRIDGDISMTVSDMHALNPWLSTEFSTNIDKTAHTSILRGYFPVGVKMSDVQDAISDDLAYIEEVSRDKAAIYCTVISHMSSVSKVNKELSSFGFVCVELPLSDLDPAKLTEKLMNDKEELMRTRDGVCERLRELSMYLSDIEVMYDIESTSLTNVMALQKTADTKSCSVIEGWIPCECSQKVTNMLDELVCAYELRDAKEGEDVPVNLKNNGFASTFEWVIEMYSYPKYASFDPTFIMSIFYFFIFGLMFADVGYGLILTVGGFMIPKLMGMRDNTKRMFYMFGFCGISSMLMGVLFGGWFGDLPYAVMENMMGIENAREILPFFNGLLFNPLDDPMLFLVVSLAVGGVHIIAGMVIKFVLLCKDGKVLDALCDILPWWIIFGGIALIFVVSTQVGLMVIGAGALIIVLTHARQEKNIVVRLLKGLLGLYDITSYASDLLSYSRILALGLAAGVIGQVVNLVGTMGGGGVMGFVALIAACLIGHTLNLAINILGSFVHTSRLQYLEFFNKFYEDGGEKFEALEPSEKYSKE